MATAERRVRQGLWRLLAPLAWPLRQLRLTVATGILLVVAVGLGWFTGMLIGYHASSHPRVCAYLPLPGKGMSAPICEQGITPSDFDARVNP